MYWTGATASGHRAPNEDWVAATSDVVVVLDGATVRTDTGCEHGPDWYTRKLGAALISAAASKSRALTEALADAIADVAHLHPQCDLSHPGTPSAAAAIVRTEGDVIRYAILGDVSLVADVSSEITVVTDERIDTIAAEDRNEALQYSVGSEAQRTALLSMKATEQHARNVPGGYWIAAADPSAAQHAITGAFSSEQVQQFAVLTDGAARLVDLFSVLDWREALSLLHYSGPAAYIQQVREFEASDPEGTRFPRIKSSDDASVVYALPESASATEQNRAAHEPDRDTPEEVTSPDDIERHAL